jgi:hypothetical protein
MGSLGKNANLEWIRAMSDFGRVAGPALFGLVAGGLYGFATVMMDKPMKEGTTGWTQSGKRLSLTRRVALHGSLGTALLTIADENAVPTDMLRKVMLACEQMLEMQAKADHIAQLVEDHGDEGSRDVKDRMLSGMDEADYMTHISRLRDLAISFLTNGMGESNVPLSMETGLPHSPSLYHATTTIITSLHDIILNVNIAVRKWRG